MFKIEDTIASQYANSPRLMLIIQELHNAIDPTKNIQDFYRIIWNLETAQGAGLDIWGRLSGLIATCLCKIQMNHHSVFIPSSPEPLYTFNDAPFRTDSGGFSAYALPDNLYRKLIFRQSTANIILATAPNINQLLSFINWNACMLFNYRHHASKVPISRSVICIWPHDSFINLAYCLSLWGRSRLWRNIARLPIKRHDTA